MISAMLAHERLHAAEQAGAPDLPVSPVKNKGGRPRKEPGAPKAKRKAPKGANPPRKRGRPPVMTPGRTQAAADRALVRQRFYGEILPGGEVVSQLIAGANEAKKRIPGEIKRLIVELTARRRTPTEVARFILAHTGFEVTLQECEYYNPTKRAGFALGSDWRRLFENTRREYDAGISNVNGSQLAWRLAELQELYDEEKLKARPNVPLCMNILEQMGKEAGGHFAKVKAAPEQAMPPLTDDEKVELVVRTMASVVKRQEIEFGTSSLMASLPEPVKRAVEEINRPPEFDEGEIVDR